MDFCRRLFLDDPFKKNFVKSQYVELIFSVAECGSIGGAAIHLGRTQPAISSALRKAENDLGAKLFERLPHGVIPTPIGQLIVERCAKILGDLISIDETVLQSQGIFSGRLNVIATPMAAISFLPNILRTYNRKFPNISVVVAGGHTPPAFLELRKGNVDFVFGPPPDSTANSGLKSIEIASSRIVIVTGKNSKHLCELDPNVLSQANWLNHGSPSRQPLFFGYFEDHGVEPPEPTVCADSISCILSMVEGSDNLFCIPEDLLDQLKGNREFGILPVADEIQPVRICLTSAKERILTPAATAFSDIVAQSILA